MLGQGVMLRSKSFFAGVLLLVAAGATAAFAQDHTLVVLSHSNHTVYELDPATGRILHEFVTPDQPHEAAITADGATVFAWRFRRTAKSGSTKTATGR